jgi:hypothetical protein
MLSKDQIEWSYPDPSDYHMIKIEEISSLLLSEQTICSLFFEDFKASANDDKWIISVLQQCRVIAPRIRSIGFYELPLSRLTIDEVCLFTKLTWLYPSQERIKC